MSRRIWLLAGAIILMVNAVQWVIAEAVTAAAWDPPYSYAVNFISDLGVADCGAQVQGRTICSPLHSLMNVSFMLEGVLFATGVVLLARLLRGRTRRIVTALALVHGVGFVLVGLFHGSPDGPRAGLVIHITAAGVGILCANAIAIIVGSTGGSSWPTGYRRFSVAVGVLGIVSEALVGISAHTAGLFERGGVYSWLLWGLVTGSLLLTGQLRPGPGPEDVPV
jgi:hypothetical membrane protein